MTTTNPDLINVRLPVYWASYIANNVKDSLEDGEEQLIKETLDLIGVKREHNADVIEDIHFEYPYYPNLEAGDYCTYVFYQL
tara:strand:- start:461 stop:706 length:246 start_codon:yes stop_codon:yes gene_type:complete